SARSSVVLPAPFGPERATRSRRSTLKETPSKRGSPLSSLRSPDAITTAIRVRVRPVTQVLALDVGTSSVRAGRFDASATEDGKPAKRQYVGEADPDPLVAAVREVLDEAGGPTPDAIGASCFGHSLVALDNKGRPLTPVLGWRDRRSADAADQLARHGDDAAVPARTGCHIHTSYWPAKLAWLAGEQPETFRAARRFASFCDYLYLQLLGREVPASLSIASATGLLDLSHRRWDEELLDAHGGAA